MEAPEKLYISKNIYSTFLYQTPNPEDETEVEYSNTDAFIEKACKAFCKVCKMPNCNSKDCSYLKDFKNYMKGE